MHHIFLTTDRVSVTGRNEEMLNKPMVNAYLNSIGVENHTTDSTYKLKNGARTNTYTVN